MSDIDSERGYATRPHSQDPVRDEVRDSFAVFFLFHGGYHRTPRKILATMRAL